jgi:hypothetical protein
MANTFKALSDFADWSKPSVPLQIPTTTSQLPKSERDEEVAPPPKDDGQDRKLELHYNIQLILPESRDQSVYDALFSSLRRHLM